MPLVIVPTPIGNLEDMTLRGLRELKEADAVACEDTRRTLRLLNGFKIKKPLISCHEHNETKSAAHILKRLAAGEKIALVSDAGTPCLSDPGLVAVREAINAGYDVDVLPGANALLPALIFSGFSMKSFIFAGFLEGRTEDKKKRLKELSGAFETLVFYVAPHKLSRELALMAETLGDREAALVREISKIHQEVIRGTLSSFCDTMTEERTKGEFVCVVRGRAREEEKEDGAWRTEAARLAASGLSMKETVSEVAEKYGAQKNAIKKFLIENCPKEA